MVPWESGYVRWSLRQRFGISGALRTVLKVWCSIPGHPGIVCRLIWPREGAIKVMSDGRGFVEPRGGATTN